MAKKKPASDYDKGFASGVVYACARILEMHDEPVIAGDILAESGVDVRHASDYDVAFLRKAKMTFKHGRD